MNAPLDTFQSALLDELRTEVAARQARAARTRGRRWSRSAAAAALVAVATGSWLAVSVSAPTPAYAVTTEADGDVVVRIHDVQDLAGLEQALAEEGVTSAVSGFAVDPGHRVVLGDELAQVRDTGGAGEPGEGTVWSDDAACGLQAGQRGAALPVQVARPDDYVITLDGDVVSSGRTLEVVTISEDGRASQLFVSYSLSGTGYCGALVGVD